VKKLLLLATALALPASVWADTIVFRNGDRLSGTITEMSGGKIKIKSAVAGEVVVDSVDVATFSTDGLIDLQLVDGTIVKQKVDAVGDGKIAFVGPSGQQELPLGSLKGINPRTDWHGSIRAGAQLVRGNTDTDDAYIAFDINRRDPNDRYTAGGAFNWARQRAAGEDDKVTTTENWTVFGKWDHFYTEKLYGFASIRVDHDRIADLEYRIAPALGLGYQWHESPVWNFWTEAGIAYVYEKYEDPEPADPNFDDDKGNVSARLAYHYDRKLNDKVFIFHNLEFFPSLEDAGDFFFVTDIGLRTALTSRMFAELKAEWRHDSEPAADALHNDMRYIVSLGWTF